MYDSHQKSDNIRACEIKIENQTIKQVNKFHYLGTIIQSDGKCEAEIKARIGMAMDGSIKWRVFESHRIILETKKQLLRTYIYPILIYGSE